MSSLRSRIDVLLHGRASVLAVRSLSRRHTTVVEIVRSVNVSFLVFVLALPLLAFLKTKRAPHLAGRSEGAPDLTQGAGPLPAME